MEETKHAVDTKALQAVIDYLNNSNCPIKEVKPLIDNLVKGAVQVNLKTPDEAKPETTASETSEETDQTTS
jgi:hypothetical protein